jgi:hypothetical protein
MREERHMKNKSFFIGSFFQQLRPVRNSVRCAGRYCTACSIQLRGHPVAGATAPCQEAYGTLLLPVSVAGPLHAARGSEALQDSSHLKHQARAAHRYRRVCRSQQLFVNHNT